MIAKLLVRLSAGVLPGNNPGQVVHTHMPLFTKQYNLIPAKCSAAGKASVGLALHWPCVTNSVVYPSTGLNGHVRERRQCARLPVVETNTPPTLQMRHNLLYFLTLN